jgi:hypothetical protein
MGAADRLARPLAGSYAAFRWRGSDLMPFVPGPGSVAPECSAWGTSGAST